MRRKSYIIGILAAALFVGAASPRLPKIVSSAHTFGRSFHAIKATARSLGPLEWFAYSMALVSTTDSTSHQK